MAFSPRKQVNQHQANRQTKSQNKPALHRCNFPGRWRMWEGGIGLQHRCEFGAEAEDRGRGPAALWRQKKRCRLELHQEKLKLAVSSRIRFSRFIFFSFILRF